MLCVVIPALLAASVLAGEPSLYSFSPEVGSGAGAAFHLSGDGPVTAVRLWERGNSVYGLQLRFGFIWSERVGLPHGSPRELELFDGESILQISGKFSYYINALQLVTSRGRWLMAGQPTGTSFNMYPRSDRAGLMAISGRVSGGITAIAAHWGDTGTTDQ